jgi:hypothetical protein
MHKCRLPTVQGTPSYKQRIHLNELTDVVNVVPSVACHATMHALLDGYKRRMFTL